MSIRMVAVELYRVMKEVEKLERELDGLNPDAPGREEIEKRLREARVEKSRLGSMLEGAKIS
ncbi:MAG: hypothetical protein ABFD97_03000 [Syntrophobacter sp.]